MMEKVEVELLKDYIDVQREATKELTALYMEIKELRKSLSNGALGTIKKRVEGLYLAIVAVIVPLIWILIKTLNNGGGK